MAEEFKFDDEVPIFVDEDAPMGDSAWDANAEVEFDEELDVDEEKTVFKRLIDLSAKNRRASLPLLIARTTKHAALGSYLTQEVWNELPDGMKYACWEKWMKDFTCAQVAKVATRLLTTCVFAGKPTHYRGYEVGGSWNDDGKVFAPSTEEDVYFVEVKPELEAAAMAAAACVKMQSDSKTTRDGEGEPMTRTTYEYRDCGATTKHPISLKKALIKFLAVKAGTPITESVAKKTPFLWEGAGRLLCKERVIVPTMAPTPGYHMLVGKKMTLPKGNVDLNSLIGINLDINVYYHTIKHSWFFGGLFLRNPSFLIFCQETYFPTLPWSGSFPKQLPIWCRKPKMAFERDGCSLGDPNLNLAVSSVVSRSLFTGVVWNPSGEGVLYTSARGVAIPVAKDMRSAKCGLEWCGTQERVVISLICAPRPFVLCLIADDVPDDSVAYFEPYTSSLFSTMWQKAAIIGYYNFVVNMMRTAYPAYPLRPVIAVGKFKEITAWCVDPVGLPFARYIAQDVKVAEDEVSAFERYFMAGTGARAKTGRAAPGAPEGEPGTKRSKRA